MLNTIKIFLEDGMVTLQIHSRKKISETNDHEKTIRLSYLSITCIHGIETPPNGTEKDFRNIMQKLTFAGWKALNTRKKNCEMLKNDYTLVVSNFRNKQRIILASWRKRKPDLYVVWGGDLADCKLLSYVQFQKTFEQYLQSFDGKKSIYQKYYTQQYQIWFGCW